MPIKNRIALIDDFQEILRQSLRDMIAGTSDEIDALLGEIAAMALMAAEQGDENALAELRASVRVTLETARVTAVSGSWDAVERIALAIMDVARAAVRAVTI